MLKSEKFDNLVEAKKCAEKNNGFVEGPFVDEQLNSTFYAFYKECPIVEILNQKNIQ